MRILRRAGAPRRGRASPRAAANSAPDARPTGERQAHSVTDSVTGAYPRALLQPRLDEELARAARQGSSCAVFMFDIDFFKTVNDAYGHLRGDEVLRQLAERVKAAVRGSDVLFRFGGDEFVLLLPDTDRAEAITLALRLTEAVRAHEFAGQPPLHLAISLGVATYPEDADNSVSLISCADRRNYLAKRRGRDSAVADDSDAGAGTVSARMWERDAALAGAQEFLTRLLTERRGAVRVTGEPGAGFTRFLSEVATVARLRGFTVVTVPADGAVEVPESAYVLLVSDLDTAGHTAGAVERLLSADRPPQSLGLVYANTGPEPAPAGLPLLASLELAPWSPAALRVFLRHTLRGEPSRALVRWLAGQSGGLPARAVSELERLRTRGGLITTAGGAWTVSPRMLGRPLRRGGLPVPLTKLIGRERERAQIAELLADSRLVTLVGPGGIGKSRLALAVAGDLMESFDDGVVFVPLAQATSAEMVIAAMAQALDIAQTPDEPLLDRVTEQLAEAQLLLVLDNFEQAMDAAGVVGGLLAAAPGVSALVTSRERLSLYGEQVYRVPPLLLPNLATLTADVASVQRALAESPALALFDQRARAASGDFTLTPDNLPVVVTLCRRLDGLPLAIELAAARTDRHTPEELLVDIAHHLDTLGDGPHNRPERHRTLRYAIDWSVELLDADDRRLFTRLAVFAGGATVDAAAAVVDVAWSRDQLADRMAALAAKSLLVAETDPGGATRYRMPETVRAYAVATLIAGPAAETIRARYAAYYAEFAERSADALTGPAQAEWAVLLDCEYQNLRAAFAAGDPDITARLCLGLRRYWMRGSRIGEGRQWLQQVLADTHDDGLTARLSYAAAVLAAYQHDHEEAVRLGTEALRLAGAAGDRRTVARAHNALALAAISAGRYALAADHLREGLAICRELGWTHGVAAALANLTKAALRLGDVDAADGYAAQCLEIARTAENARGIVLGLGYAGEILLAKGDVRGARTNLQESLRLSRTISDLFGEATALHHLGSAARADGDSAAALRLFAGALARRLELGDWENLATSLDSVAGLVADFDPRFAAQLLGAADEVRDRHRLCTPMDGGREAVRDAVTGTLGTRDFTAAWADGRHGPVALIVDQVLDLVPSAA